MSQVIGPNIQLVSREPSFDPRSGFRMEETWRGTKAAVQSKAAQFQALGFRYRITQNGASYTVVASFPDLNDGSGGSGTGSDAIADVWEFDMEDERVSVWSLPDVDYAFAVIKTYNGAPASELKRGIIEDADNGREFSLQLPDELQEQRLVLEKVHKCLVRGVEAVPLKQPVISRTRTFATTNPQKIKLTTRPLVYTTSALLREFSVPSDIALQLPDEPGPKDTPSGTRWSWRLRLDRTRFVGSLAKTEESRDWVYAAWPLLAFTVVKT